MRARTQLQFLLPVFLFCGCGGEAFSDYNLKLVPHPLQGQDPFKDGRVIKLMIQEPEGEPEYFFVGNTGAAELELGELPPISPGSTVGILVEEQGGDVNTFNVDLAVAWGSNFVDGGLALGGEELVIDILVPELNRLGDMDQLPEAQRAYGTAAAMVNGQVYLFGGAKDLNPTDLGTSKILKMSNMDVGDFTFDRLDVDMPTYDAIDGFFGSAAINIDVDGEPQILVTGGRLEPGGLPGQPSDGAFLFDPATDEITWGNKPNHNRMRSARSEHQMLVMNNGKALIYGGFNPSFNASFEIFDPSTKRFELQTGLDFGPVEAAAVNLGTQGVMICGGAEVPSDTTVPVDGCVTINLQGLATNGPPLVTPVFAFDMTQLADGRVLAAGGITTTTTDNDNAAATDRAWILDGNTWTQLPSTLNFPRAHHRIIPLPNGNALVLGGAGTGGGIFPNPTDAVVCPELFDAQTNVFVKLDPCTNSGSGAWPQWAIQEGDGLFVLSGFAADTDDGGDAYGFVAFTPEL